MELWLPQPLSMRPGWSFCRLLVLDFPSLDSSSSVVHRHPSAGSLGDNSCVLHAMHACVHVCSVCMRNCICTIACSHVKSFILVGGNLDGSE